jgi:hypothetical protein
MGRAVDFRRVGNLESAARILGRACRLCGSAPSHAKWCLPYFIALVSAACGSGSGADTSEELAIRDSAGIRIVTVAFDPLDHALPRVQFTVTDTATGPSAKFFDNVVGAAIFPTGVVVVDRGLSTLRLFSFSGDLLSEIGRSGDGPGEFQRISWAQKFGEDGLLVWDHELYRLSQFEVSNGSISYVGVWPSTWPATRGLVYPLGVLADSVVVLFVPSPFQSATDGLNSPTYHVRIGYDGPEIVVPGQSVFVEAGVVLRQPFRYAASVSVNGGDLWVGSGTIGELARYRSDGSIVELLRFQPGRPVTAEDREAFVADYLGSYSGSRRIVRQSVIEDVPFPDRHAAFQTALAMQSGEVILRIGSPEAPAWLSYSPAGLRKLSLPPGAYPLARHGTQAVLRYLDAMDVHRVFLARATAQ